jgi:transposase
LVNDYADEALSRATIWRTLNAADLKPHQSVYWLNSHDPDFEQRAKGICALYVQSPVLYEHGQLVICSDEKTGMQILQRKYPTQPARPGHPEKREQDYIRHGTRALIASFVVPTGEVVWDLGLTRTSQDFAAHLLHVARQVRGWQGMTWVLDNLNTHWSVEVCEVLAMLNELPFCPRSLRTGAQRRAFLTDPEHAYRFVFTPKHGSWLNQVELWFSVLARRFLKRGDFAGAEQFEVRLRAFLEDYNSHQAHPYRWTYTGQPLVRGTPFSATRRQQRRGRAWFGGRPQRFDRYLYPPRPYKRQVA